MSRDPAPRLAPLSPVVVPIALLPVLAVAWPPELFPWSRVAVHLIALLGLFLAIFHEGDPPSFISSPPWLSRWIPGLLPFAGGAILSAACRSRAIDELSDALLLIVAGFLGWWTARRSGAKQAAALLMAALGCGVAVDAIVQHWVIYPSAASALRSSGGAGSAAILNVLEAGRPSGPFILPAALGGFLALSLPLTLALLGPGVDRARRAVLYLALATQVYALVLTRSFGAVIALAAALLLALAIRKPRRRVAMAAVVVLLAVLGAGWFLVSRRLEVEAAAGNDPLSLRWGNWRAACMMIREHPFFGVGPGSFATAYPRFMHPGMNETRYAHNSYLQAAATWGLWIAAPVGAILLAFARRVRAAGPDDPIGAGLLAAGASFLVHNLGDFTAWLPSLALPAGLLLGLATGLSPGAPEAARRRNGRRAFLLSTVLAVAALDLRHQVNGARMRAALAAAADAAQHLDFDRALREARRAAALRPDDPEPHAFLAELILDRLPSQPLLVREGEVESDRALTLDPEAAILHYTRALYHQAAGESAAAYRERFAARKLYPEKSLYRAPQPADR
ncbi:MAG TPA: O-antigen ligase family protein [Candidatus Polarisedimenticolia bacterium]